ncbi:MAG: hypothetical protein ACOX2O_03980 [Bdellovibrionota bacterium]|jgi:hypothetical protein
MTETKEKKHKESKPRKKTASTSAKTKEVNSETTAKVEQPLAAEKKSTRKKATSSASKKSLSKTVTKSRASLPKFKLKIKPIKALTSKEHLPSEELLAINKSREERGHALADLLFEYANKKRILDLDTYVEAIQEAVRGKRSEENQAILRAACAYFKEKYTKWCRERGNSVELLDNIVRRTGKETEPFLAKLLHGFDVKEMARELWDLDVQKKTAELRIARQQIYELTNDQVTELREEYNTIPSQDLATEIHTALYATNLTGEAQPDVSAIKYALRGRTLNEVKQIEFQFNEKYHFVYDDSKEPPLRQQLRDKLSEKDAREIEKLLKGFSSREVAENVHDLLVHCSEASEVIQTKKKIHPDFSGNFRRDYSAAPVIERELRAREEIDHLIEYLTPAQFKNVNRQLEQRFSEKLTEGLYSCNHPFDPRKVAIQLFRSFQNVPQRRQCRKDQDYLAYSQVLEIKSRFSTSTHSEITEIITKWANEQKASESFQIIKQALLPIQDLDPTQLFYVKKWFYVCTGLTLQKYIEERVNFLCRNDVPKYVAIILKNRLAGTSRLPLKADLFDLFSTAEQRQQNYINLEPQAKLLEQAKADARAIDKILSDKQDARKSKALLAFLEKRNRDQSNAMEKAFLELSKGVPLIEAIRSKVKSKKSQTAAILLLSQFHVWEEAKRIDKDPEHLLTLLAEPPRSVAFVLQEYRATYKKNLSSIIKSSYKGQDLQEKRLLLNSVLFTPNVLKLHKIFKTTEPLPEESLHFLTRQLSRPRLDVLAFEAAYNRYFARFEYCQDKLYGSLLQQLRILATEELIPRQSFASAVLLLEDVDPSIPVTMQNHLSEKEIGGNAIIKLHQLLRDFKDHLKILQKAYNALNEKNTLRETIYDLKIPLEVKNKTLLLLDGYDPDAVAKEIITLLKKDLSAEKLGAEICAILATSTPKAFNPRIPLQANWIDEMYHQIRVSYEAQTGSRLIADLLRRNVPMKGAGINAITYKLYGEVAKTVINIRHLVSLRGTAADKFEVTDRKIVQTLADLLPALRERAMNMYDAYYSDVGGSLSLLAEIKTFSNKLVRQNGIELLEEALVWDTPEQ